MFFGRGKNKAQNPYTLRDIYDYYIKDVCKIKSYKIPYSVYKKINNQFYKGIVNNMLEKAGTFHMPYRLGKFFVLKEKIDLDRLAQAIDWEKTNKYGKIIYHLNEHTNGYKYSYQWEKKKSAIPN